MGIEIFIDYLDLEKEVRPEFLRVKGSKGGIRKPYEHSQY